LAPLGILMIGIGGWLMYEGYKGQSIGSLKTRSKSQGQAIATAKP
jgi:hypothetical protein